MDILTLGLSGDAFQGLPIVSVTMDGAPLGDVTIIASHTYGQVQPVAFAGEWGPGAHDVVVTFTNDLYGGSALTDRNAYVHGVGYNGVYPVMSQAALMSTGDHCTMQIAATKAPAKPSASAVGTVISTVGPVLTDTAGNTYALNAAKQILLNGSVVTSSADVASLAMTASGVQQTNGSGAIWTVAATNVAGTYVGQVAAPVVSTPVPPIVAIPATAAPAAAPAAAAAAPAYSTPFFEDDFSTLSLISTSAITNAWPPANADGNWAPLLQQGWPTNKPPADMSAFYETANSEAECYMASQLQLIPGGGVSLVAQKGVANPAGQPWGSAILTQNRKFGIAGGYFEIVAALPQTNTNGPKR